MNNQSILIGVIGLIIGVLLTWGFTASQNSNIQTKITEQPHATSSSMGQSMSMDDMVEGLKGKTGDEFDKAFIYGMIKHHEGAVSMANEAKINAKHDEIKSMANDIISAQTKEINQMREWQKNWGYQQ